MKRFALLLFLLIATPGWGAVAYVTSGTGTETGTDTTVSATVDATGTNLVAFCAVHHNGAGAQTVTGITYNSVAMTQSAVGEISAGGYAVDVWRLIAPTTGSQTVTATLSGTGANKILSCIVLSGVDQTTPLGTGGSYSGAANPGTATITIPTNGAGIAFGTANDQANAGSYTVDGNSIKRFDLADTDGNFAAIGSTTVTAGSNAQTISNPATDYLAMIIFPVNAATASTRRPIGAITFQ